jgi:hypothetical protein
MGNTHFHLKFMYVYILDLCTFAKIIFNITKNSKYLFLFNKNFVCFSFFKIKQHRSGIWIETLSF